MPRPPILPTLDWPGFYSFGETFDEWLAGAESADNARKMAEDRRALALEPPETAFLAALPRAVHVVAIAEDWCGDVIRHAPVLARLADAAPNLHVRYISREKALQAFERFLTNGGEAIPKFIFLNADFVECGHWGPMPDACRELIARGKACNNIAAAREKVSTRYAADPDRREVIRELLHLIGIASAIRP